MLEHLTLWAHLRKRNPHKLAVLQTILLHLHDDLASPLHSSDFPLEGRNLETMDSWEESLKLLKNLIGQGHPRDKYNSLAVEKYRLSLPR